MRGVKLDTYHGEIWFHDPDIQLEAGIPARLTINEIDVKVEFSLYVHVEPQILTLYGNFIGLSRVTMINCQTVRRQSASIHVYSYSVEKLMIGIFLKPKHLTFKKFYADIPSLLDWTNESVIHDQTVNSETKITVRKYEDKIFFDSEDITITYGIRNQLKTEKIEHRYTISEGAFLCLESKTKPLELWESLYYVEEFRKIFFLLGNISCKVTEMTIKYENSDFPITLLYGRFPQFYPSYDIRPILFNKIANNLIQITESWFKTDGLQTSIDLILEKSVNVRLSETNYFLNTCFAIETLHRKFWDYKLFPKPVLKPIKKSIIDSTDNQALRKAIRDSLSNVNSPNLRTRLLRFTKDYQILLDASEPDTETFLAKIAVTRNTFAHGLDKPKADHKVFNSKKEIFQAALVSEVVIRANLFRLLNVPEDVITDFLQVSKKVLKHTLK